MSEIEMTTYLESRTISPQAKIRRIIDELFTGNGNMISSYGRRVFYMWQKNIEKLKAPQDLEKPENLEFFVQQVELFKCFIEGYSSLFWYDLSIHRYAISRWEKAIRTAQQSQS